MQSSFLGVNRLNVLKYFISATQARDHRLTSRVKLHIDLIHNFAVQSALTRSIDSQKLAAFRSKADESMNAWDSNTFKDDFDFTELLEASISSCLFTQLGLIHQTGMSSLEQLISTAKIHRLYQGYLAGGQDTVY
jgi:hypothetical protein